MPHFKTKLKHSNYLLWLNHNQQANAEGSQIWLGLGGLLACAPGTSALLELGHLSTTKINTRGMEGKGAAGGHGGEGGCKASD